MRLPRRVFTQWLDKCDQYPHKHKFHHPRLNDRADSTLASGFFSPPSPCPHAINRNRISPSERATQSTLYSSTNLRYTTTHKRKLHHNISQTNNTNRKFTIQHPQTQLNDNSFGASQLGSRFIELRTSHEHPTSSYKIIMLRNIFVTS